MVIDNELVGERAAMYRHYPELFKVGELLPRTEIARRAGRSYGTATYHLERCVSAGILHKRYDFIGNQPGWLYALPETMPRLEGL